MCRYFLRKRKHTSILNGPLWATKQLCLDIPALNADFLKEFSIQDLLSSASLVSDEGELETRRGPAIATQNRAGLRTLLGSQGLT